MAESANTLLQSSIKIRYGRKWKSRCCVLVKLSPVSDQVILKFYKSEKELQAGKEIRRERFVVAAQNFCGIESCFRHPKNPFVLTVVCIDKIALLSFSCHADLLDWYHKIRNQLTSVSEFKCRVAIPNRGKLPPGPAMIYIYDNHFAITSQIPSLLYGGWSLADVTRYGIIEDGFAFDVVSTKDGGTFVVLCGPEQAENLKTHVDAATHCVSNRWSHISDTVSIHEETLPNRRDFSQEWQNLMGQDGNNQNGRRNGSIPSLPGSPKAKYSPDTYSSKVQNTAMIEYYKQHASSTDTDDESVKERLLEDLCLNLAGGANSPNGNNNTSPRTQTDVDGNVVDIIQLYRTLTLTTGATCPGGSAENSNGSEETTFTNLPTYVRTPTKKTTPIREQNYEIMASFDRFRNPMPVSHQRVQNVTNNAVTDSHSSASSPQKSKVDDNDYVNLPTPKEKGSTAVPKLNTTAAAVAAMHNAVNNKVTNVEKRPSVDVENNEMGGAAAAGAGAASEHVETSGDHIRAPPLAKAAAASSYRTLQHLEMSRTGSNGSTSSDAAPSLPTTPTGKTFPPPFENLTELGSAVRPKRRSKSKKNAPVPFDHGELIKPVGPIAMLSVEANASGCSRSASESGDDIGHLGSSELLDECSEKSSSLRSRGRSLSRSRSRSESCDNGCGKDAIRPEDLPSPLPPDPLRTQLSGHLSDPSLLDSVDEDTYLDLNDSGRGSPTETYDFPVDRRPASPTSDPSSTLSPLSKKISLRRGGDSSRGSSVGTASPSGPLSSPTNYPTRRKRCNTEPTAEFARTPSSGSSTWSRSRSNSRGKSLDIEEGDGYLMMMPVYEEKLKRCQASAKGIPQSPIHGGLNKASTSAKLRRSATVSGDVSTMSPRMNRSKTLRERSSASSTPPIAYPSGTLTYRRPRGNSEGVINPGDIPRSTRTDRTKHHYGPALDPSLLKKLTHKLNKFASGQDGGTEQQQQHHEPLPEVTPHSAQFAIDPANLGSLNNNVDQCKESSSKHNLLSCSADSSQDVGEPNSIPNGHAVDLSSERTHDCNANPHEVD